MCDVLSGSLAAATFLIGTVSSIMENEAANQQYEAQKAYQKAQQEEYIRTANLNNQAAAQEAVNQMATERIQQMQEQQATAREIQRTQVEALQKKGTMMASTNAAGGALDALMADYERQEAVNKDVLREQYQMQSIGHDLNTQAMVDKAQNRINSQGSYISAPITNNSSFLSTALGIGKAGLNAYGIYDRYSSKGDKPIEPTGNNNKITGSGLSAAASFRR